LKKKPNSPSSIYLKHTRPITSLEIVDENTFWSSSADSTIQLWDIRNPNAVLDSFSPDNKSVLNLKLNPDRTIMGISTLKGLYFMSIQTKQITPVTPPNKKMIFPDICWNLLSGNFYGGNIEGEIVVMDQTFAWT